LLFVSVEVLPLGGLVVVVVMLVDVVVGGGVVVGVVTGAEAPTFVVAGLAEFELTVPALEPAPALAGAAPAETCGPSGEDKLELPIVGVVEAGFGPVIVVLVLGIVGTVVGGPD
jgi:hypothetical protein